MTRFTNTLTVLLCLSSSWAQIAKAQEEAVTANLPPETEDDQTPKKNPIEPAATPSTPEPETSQQLPNTLEMGAALIPKEVVSGGAALLRHG